MGCLERRERGMNDHMEGPWMWPNNHPWPETQSGQWVVTHGIRQFLESFLPKNHDYADNNFALGSGGEANELKKKVLKLYRNMVDGVELRGEQPDELLNDIIGHAFLAKFLLQGDDEPKALGLVEFVREVRNTYESSPRSDQMSWECLTPDERCSVLSLAAQMYRDAGKLVSHDVDAYVQGRRR